jgi:hypothetical protein
MCTYVHTYTYIYLAVVWRQLESKWNTFFTIKPRPHLDGDVRSDVLESYEGNIFLPFDKLKSSAPSLADVQNYLRTTSNNQIESRSHAPLQSIPNHLDVK